MEKYLGNKSSMLPAIHAFLETRIPEARSLSDLFSGTTNVARYFRARGWRVAASDSNRFSYVLAQAYLGLTGSPQFAGLPKVTCKPARLSVLRREFNRLHARFGPLYLPNQACAEAFHDLDALAKVLGWLQEHGEANRRPGVITDHYTQWGSRSRFTSLRGTEGVRNYFSEANAAFLDTVLDTLRTWWRSGVLTRPEVFLLLTSILEEIVITANVNGTFHDFNRNRIWPNAEQNFFLRVPLLTCHGLHSELANAEVHDAAGAFSRHAVCYLDPPYNFRQYTSYYHFLNFIAAYPFLEDVDGYLEGITHVRGQQPLDDFTSPFCFRNRFIDSLRSLIEGVDAEHVVLSYYGGRNHWNHWSKGDAMSDRGLVELRTLFEDPTLFSSCEIVPTMSIRQNYQSRVGEQKSLVDEYLFHGTRLAGPRVKMSEGLVTMQNNERFQLREVFAHSREQDPQGNLP